MSISCRNHLEVPFQHHVLGQVSEIALVNLKPLLFCNLLHQPLNLIGTDMIWVQQARDLRAIVAMEESKCLHRREPSAPSGDPPGDPSHGRDILAEYRHIVALDERFSSDHGGASFTRNMSWAHIWLHR